MFFEFTWLHDRILYSGYHGNYPGGLRTRDGMGMRMIFCAHPKRGWTRTPGGGGGGGGNVRLVKTRIPGEATYPEAIIGFHH